MKKEDHTNHRFERLVALAYVGGKRWLCRCDCGIYTAVFAHSLKTGRTKSCGCLRSQIMSATKRTHGMSNTPEWHAYHRMIDRCTNPNNHRFSSYGGRGIKVCERWLQSFENFYSDMGNRPELHSIERLDVDGDYSPKNCVWATSKQQARNTTRTIMITFNGKKQCLADWAAEIKVPYSTLYDRYVRGLSAASIMELAS